MNKSAALLLLLLAVARNPTDAFRASPGFSSRAFGGAWKRHAISPATEGCTWATSKFENAKDSVSDAVTTAAALRDLWTAVEEMGNDVEGDTKLLRFPRVAAFEDPSKMAAFLEHLEDCKDVCERFGSDVYSFGHHPCEYNGELKEAVIELRKPSTSTAEDSGMFWEIGGSGEDAWDEDWDLEEPLGDAAKKEMQAYGPGGKLNPEGLSDDELVTINKEWVQSVVAGLGVCPFATSSERAGLPLGDVGYPIERCTDAETMFKKFWSEVARLQDSDERSLSTTMLVAPNFCLQSADAFDAFSTTLTRALVPLGLDEGDEGIQLVFFHPGYEFRDGADRMASDSESKEAKDAAAGNYARRSPHPMINILRTPQVRAAQRVIPTGVVYVQNQRTLGQVGADRLQEMLETATWDDLQSYKVDRREGLWKRAATVTAAVEAAQGSREGIDDVEFDEDAGLTIIGDEPER